MQQVRNFLYRVCVRSLKEVANVSCVILLLEKRKGTSAGEWHSKQHVMGRVRLQALPCHQPCQYQLHTVMDTS